MSTIHIKGEAVPLKVFDTTIYESLYLQLYTSTVTVGTTKFKIRPLNDDNLIAKAGVIRGAITHLASRENMDILPFVSPARRRWIHHTRMMELTSQTRREETLSNH